RLELGAGAIRGFGGDATLSAGTIRLVGLEVPFAGSAGTGTGTLRFEANDILLGTGNRSLSGYGLTELAAADLVRLEGIGSTQVAGDMQIRSAAVTGLAGANQTLAVTGALGFERATGTASATDAPGARFVATAGSIASSAQMVFRG